MGERYRHEYKYLISESQAVVLKSRVTAIMKPDPHADENGTYNIRSLYFDDYDDDLLTDNEIGVSPRKKYRMRIYNGSSDKVFTEIKEKINDRTLKHSKTLTRAEAEEEIRLMKTRYGLIPKTITSYDRTPFIYALGNVRVTFDANISASTDFKNFFEKSIRKRPILPAGMLLLEVKWDDYLPDHIYSALSLDRLQQTAFSKYYLCRTHNL